MKVSGGLGILILSRAVQAIVSFLVLKILTTHLPQDDVAHYYFVVAASTAFTLMVLNPVGMWVNRHVLEWRDRYNWSHLRSLIIGFYALVGTVGVSSILLSNYFLNLNETVGTLALLLGIVAILSAQSLYQFLAGVQNILGSKEMYARLIITSQAFIAGTALLVFVFSSPTLVHWFVLMLSGYLLANLFFLRSISREFKGEERPRVSELIPLQSLVTFCLPIVGVTSAIWIQSQGYRIVLSALGNLEALALIAIGLGIAANIGAIVESLAQQYLVPDFYRAIQDKPNAWHGDWFDMLRRVTLLLGISCAGMFYFSDVIVRLLTSQDYADGGYYLRWGAGIEFLRNLVNFIYLKYVGEKQVAKALPAFLFGALTTIVVYGVVYITNSNHHFVLVGGILAGCSVCASLLLWSARREFQWQQLLKTLLVAGVCSLPFAFGMFVPVDSSYGWVISSVAAAAFYAGFVLWFLTKRKLL